jgi:uncharacterized protein
VETIDWERAIAHDGPLITDLAQIQQLAHQRHDDFEVMMYMLQLDNDIDDATLDAQVEIVVQPIVAAIDCTQCANCCQVLDVYLTEADGDGLHDAVTIPLNEVFESAEHIGEWGKLRSSPCRFLDGNLCSIYPHRPESCHIYPVFTPDFRWTLADLIDGAAICPIIYNVLDRLATPALPHES